MGAEVFVETQKTAKAHRKTIKPVENQLEKLIPKKCAQTSRRILRGIFGKIDRGSDKRNREIGNDSNQ